MSKFTNTYWNHNGKYNTLAAQLQELIPAEGAVVNPRKNKKLEKFRKAVNCYYDLYNNGLINRASSFAKVFGIPARDYKYGLGRRGFMACLYIETEQVMDKIVYEAAVEQGFAPTFE